MFTKKHYEYLADKVLGDDGLDTDRKAVVFTFLLRAFSEDFPNFDIARWLEKWTDQSPSLLASQVELRSSESSETKPTKPG